MSYDRYDSQSILSLELQENAEAVSMAIGAYISDKISKLESLQNEHTLQEYVQRTLQEKAEGTLLWMALVVQELPSLWQEIVPTYYSQKLKMAWVTWPRKPTVSCLILLATKFIARYFRFRFPYPWSIDIRNMKYNLAPSSINFLALYLGASHVGRQ